MKYHALNFKSMAMISIIGLVYLVIIIIAMHKLRPDYNPRSRYISEYAVGKYGQLATSSFVIYGLAILGIYLCLKTVLPFNVKANLGLTLIAIWGVAKVITGFFNVDLKDKQMSLQGTVHSIASCIGVAAFVIGLIFLSINLAHTESTQSIAFFTQIVAILASILVVLLFLGFLGDLALKYNHPVPSIIFLLHKLTGVTERLLLGISVVWLMIIAKSILSEEVRISALSWFC
jgi:hypothetical protein